MLQNRKIAVILAAATASISGSACGMTMPRGTPQHCQVVGGEKLPAEVGAAAICDAIKRAVAAQAPGLDYRVEVRVLSPSRLAATLTTGDGRELPELNHAISDSKLTKVSMERFAQGIALQLGKGSSL